MPVPEELQQLWMGERLHGPDNRTLFQAIAEIVSISHYGSVHGWQIEVVYSDACIRLQTPLTTGRLKLLVVLSLILDADLEQEKQTPTARTRRCKLNQLESAYHIGLYDPNCLCLRLLTFLKSWR